MDFYNKGIYTYSDASRLLGQSKAVIRGLVNGYKYKDRPQKPVISKKTVTYEDKEYLTFYDIIELKFINYFLSCGVKRKTIVDAYEKAKKELNKDYPFATHFTTDGTYIYADNKVVFLGLHNNQFDFRSICLPNRLISNHARKNFQTGKKIFGRRRFRYILKTNNGEKTCTNLSPRFSGCCRPVVRA